MLNPNERQLYLEALKPPAGYSLDTGVATTFSLDLLTLLIIPLSFVMFDSDDAERDLKDPVKILEALRRTAGKITICCQKGRISIPGNAHLLYSYLEDSIFEVNQPKGVFHPKNWLLRYTSEGKSPIYRLLCLSRNLTFDKSWDTILVLTGEVGLEEHLNNQPLLDFIKSLPGVNEDKLATFKKELPRVDFEPPAGYDKDIRFRPLGLEGYKEIPIITNADRMLVVSPFLTDNFLQHLTRDKVNTKFFLISRLDSLGTLEPITLEGFEKIYVLDDPTMGVEGHDTQNTADLHAKLFIAEKENNVRLWTGSANATSAAFSANVEFLTELSGLKKDIGIDAFLDPDKNPFRSMLLEYAIPDERHHPDSVQVELKNRVDAVRTQLTSAGLELQVFAGSAEGEYNVVLYRHYGALDLEAMEAKCWPISINEQNAVDLKALGLGGEVFFSAVSVESITSFIAFELTGQSGRQKYSARFVLNVPLQGMPENRNERILYSMISDRGRFLRYLLFLLAEDQGLDIAVADFARKVVSGKVKEGQALPDIPLMEQMIRALCRNPEKIDAIARLIEDISKTDKDRKVFPLDFDKLWQPVWEARRRMVKDK